ncbi:helix-turn-helix transcriptional regulator [Candidatus Collinsella stercoripullorum]|uniref:helix-turn-helix transcriptional regulator n=1 Tax=Candidatus Collinsella stercoripullorum TaxID=2838522 RepID=UPI0022E58975|nr:helix-turn-helix transcriptional regulator [Candidatus Collinsella stercoripullorum]
MELARRIKEHRARLGMSQADLARALFVTRQTISNWETSRTYPDAQSLLLMSGLFGVSVDSLLKDDSQEMREALAAGSRKMNRLGAVMAAFGLACAAWVVVGIALDWDTALIAVPAAALFAPAMCAAFLVDKMRHDNQLFAYQSVLAFLAGEDPDVSNRYNQRAREHWVARRVAQTVLFIILGLCCGWGAAGIISRLFG